MWHYKHCRNYEKCWNFAFYNLGGKGGWDSIWCVLLSLWAVGRVWLVFLILHFIYLIYFCMEKIFCLIYVQKFNALCLLACVRSPKIYLIQSSLPFLFYGLIALFLVLFPPGPAYIIILSSCSSPFQCKHVFFKLLINWYAYLPCVQYLEGRCVESFVIFFKKISFEIFIRHYVV